MDNKQFFKNISEIHLEGCLELPIEELVTFDNSHNIKNIKFSSFQAKKNLFIEQNNVLIEQATQKIKDKVNKIIDLPIEALQEMLLQRSPNMQFRNFEKLERDELLRILEDYMILDDLEDENE